MTASAKLTEARFFLDLFDVLEERKRSLTDVASSSEEASFLLSAILNALYSSLEQAKPAIGVEAVVKYKSEHAKIFRGNGGLRNITVHERHVGVDFSGYIPSLGNAVNFDLRLTPKLVKEAEAARSPGIVNISLGPDFYVEVDGNLVNISDLCYQQYYSLRNFLHAHGLLPNNSSKPTPSGAT